MPKVYDIIQRLKEADIYFEIKAHREDFIMLEACVPGERWEIEISPKGYVEIEVFKSDGTIYGRSKLEDLFTRFSD